MKDIYEFLDDVVNDALNIDVGFTNLVNPNYYEMPPHSYFEFQKRYEFIREFQRTILGLLNQSISGDADPIYADLMLNELPSYQKEFIRAKSNYLPSTVPLFFRTDEPTLGKICEIQCPGSSWGIHEVMQKLHLDYHGTTHPSVNKNPLSQLFAEALKTQHPGELLIQHLQDSTQAPQYLRYFIQQTRKHGLKYYGFDKGVVPMNCNVVRGHNFYQLITDPYVYKRIDLLRSHELIYDLPPTIAFDQKIAMVFPFWEKTRNLFSDEVRDIFPFTSLIELDTVTLSNGDKLTHEEFCNMSKYKRTYFIKYAGSDPYLKTGSRGVYYGKALSKKACFKLFSEIKKGFVKKKYWILQQAFIHKDNVDYLDRSGNLISFKGNSKFSGFYGPTGFLGALIMNRNFYKVHGNEETVISFPKFN